MHRTQHLNMKYVKRNSKKIWTWQVIVLIFRSFHKTLKCLHFFLLATKPNKILKIILEELRLLFQKIFRVFIRVSLGHCTSFPQRVYGYIKYISLLVSSFLCNEGRRKELMLFKTSLKFSLPMHVLYKLNLSSFLSFIFPSYLFSNWSQTIGAFISSSFSLQCNEIFKWLTDLQVIDNSV